MNKEHTWRYTLLGAVVSVLPLLIVFQMLRIQTNPEQVSAFLAQGDLYSGVTRTAYPPRGLIYDRWGGLLAGNKMVYEIGVELQDVRNPNTIALTLNYVLGLDYTNVLEAVSQKPSKDAVYAVLANSVDPEKMKQIWRIRDQINLAPRSSQDDAPPSLRGLVAYPKLQRTYPEKDLASNILGFVSQEGRGYFGVEEKFNELLAGKPKTFWVPNDPNQVEELPDVPDGASLVLTIDRAIQDEVEQIIDRAVDANDAQSGTIVVMNPKTGEILAMATTPRLDLNEFWRYSEVFPKDTPFNRGVSQAYETGSVYKVLTMAAGLDSGAVKPETSFLDTGVFEIGGTYIYNWNSGAWGPQDMQGCMQHSLNVCLAWIATQIGTRDFYRYMQDFGMGRLTGVDMAGEVPGRLKIPGDEDWYDADLGTNSFGQGVASTPIQMAASISAIANEGKMMAPHVVRSMVNKGYQHEFEQRLIGMPVRAETARTLSEMLARSLETESSDALVTGYRVAGKTGTGEIPTPFGYTSNLSNASFVGWGPVDDPHFVVYVWLEKPTSSIWGSVVAAPVFREVVERLVVLMKLPPDDVRRQILSQ